MSVVAGMKKTNDHAEPPKSRTLKTPKKNQKTLYSYVQSGVPVSVEVLCIELTTLYNILYVQLARQSTHTSTSCYNILHRTLYRGKLNTLLVIVYLFLFN